MHVPVDHVWLLVHVCVACPHTPQSTVRVALGVQPHEPHVKSDWQIFSLPLAQPDADVWPGVQLRFAVSTQS